MYKKIWFVLLVFFVFPLQLQADNSQDNLFKMLDLFGEVFSDIQENYVEDVSDKELLEHAINGMLNSLDPHSSYLNEDYYKDLQSNTKGEFGGLGIEITLDSTGYIKIIAPIDDTPAFKAGIIAGDIITHINGKSVLNQTLAESVKVMRGKVGDPIIVTIARDGGEPFDVEIIRDIIKIRSVSSRLEGHYGYIRITSFSKETTKELVKNIKMLQADYAKISSKKIQGYVLDLRNNPGGLLTQAIAVSDEFLQQGEIVSTRGRHKNNTNRFLANKGDIIDGAPLVILINAGSASASEIVAGALQDHSRAVILGVKSFGKGSVQTIIPLSQQDIAIKLTTQRYYTPSGRSIQGLGITPDIEVKQQYNTPNTESDNKNNIKEADLVGALTNDNDDDDSNDTQQNFSDEANNDYQLLRALLLLKGLSIYLH